MEYRSNFLLTLAVESCFLLSKLIYAAVVYKTGIQLGGLSPDAMFLYIGVFILITAFYTGLFMNNFYRLPDYVREGTLDLLITKPVSTLFMVSTRHVDFAIPVPNMIAGGIIIAIGWRRLSIPFDFVHVAGFAGLLLCGVFLAYSLYLFPQILTFWTVRTSAVVEFADKAWDFNTMPMAIYRRWMQRIGTSLFPIFLIFNVPAMFLWNQLTWKMALWSIAAPLLFMGLVRIFWNVSIKRYSSAGG
nr:ABC-2 family transporter protein [Cohnella sp. CFH 77786]